MAYYLIDYENVGEAGLKGITALEEGDHVIIFYSENAGRISFDLHRKLNETAACIEYQKVASGMKNALDFQLATYLGYLIAKHDEDTLYYIVSKDNGYDAVKSFWKNHSIFLSGNLAGKSRTGKGNLPYEDFDEHVCEAPKDGMDLLWELSGFKKELTKMFGDTVLRDELLMFLERYRTLQDLNNALVKWYGSDRAYILYKQIKPLVQQAWSKKS